MSFSIDEQRRLSEAEKLFQKGVCDRPLSDPLSGNHDIYFFGITKIVSLASEYYCSLGRLH